MKLLFSSRLWAFFSFALLLFIFSSCDIGNKEDPIKVSPDAATIGDYIRTLGDDSKGLLNTQNISGASQRTQVNSRTSSSGFSGGYTECKTVTYDLKNNFENIAILRPTNGIIYPGALVIADKETLGGLPTPAGVDRAPVSLRLDLPGIGENGNIIVDNPSNTTVQPKIDEALEWWNANAYQDGYVNAANSSYSASTSYSSRQLSMDVGLNVEWARGDVSAQFNYESTKTERVAMMVFKQVFYSITMNEPFSPGEVFGPNTSLEDVELKFSASAPPAYVQAVNYGRIIMFRMISTTEATDVQLEGALNYATGLTSNISAELEATYKNILNNSSITVVTIGGNASVASKAVEATSFGDLNEIITGENAVYTRNNPGVPISYKLTYLKDNSTAKLGYTTEYEVETCQDYQYPSKPVSLNNKNGFLGPTVRFTIAYKQRVNGIEYNKSIGSGSIKTNTKAVKTIPAGAYGIRVTIEVLDGFKWKFLSDKTYSKPTQVCLQTTTNTLKTKIYLNEISC
ncbi:thiol-activated cytolysin family protein [Algoriphagus machipongonensis]|uniref:Perfringolysin O n=1 Tax=Algoriphagus machipongonensis TaxID=388413 RepID=A3I0X0_9BACT|nr:thiol-activated cytolysin family protein [Algoriphagus machipongonensis]EAZ80116.1 putative perfringolysin O [Algoriphagus machipongonensis]